MEVDRWLGWRSSLGFFSFSLGGQGGDRCGHGSCIMGLVGDGDGDGWVWLERAEFFWVWLRWRSVVGVGCISAKSESEDH